MFIAIAVFGVLLLALALLADDVFEGLFEGLFEGDMPGGGWFSTTAVAAFCAALGFTAAVLQWRFDLPALAAGAGGSVAGVALATVATRWSRSLSTMHTDPTPTSNDLLGCQGRIVTPVPTGAAGEALVRLAGQQVKLSAVAGGRSAAEPLAAGADIVVVGVLSPTRVEVEAAESFWA